MPIMKEFDCQQLGRLQSAKLFVFATGVRPVMALKNGS